MNDFLKVNVRIVGLENDIKKQEKIIENTIPKALQYVGAEMMFSLQKHIAQDWYKAYIPSSYQRRTDNPSLGTPLGSEKNMTPVENMVRGKNLTFNYYPTGEYIDGFYYVRNGNDLIESIQTGNLWGEPPPRPFWNNFVHDQEREAVENFINGMKQFGTEGIEIKADNNESVDLKDSLLKSENEQTHFNI